MTKDSDAVKKHLASIDANLDRLVKALAPQGDASFGDGPKRLAEPATEKTLGEKIGINADDTKAFADAVRKFTTEADRRRKLDTETGYTITRRTEPGNPVTDGEGDWVLNPEADTSGN